MTIQQLRLELVTLVASGKATMETDVKIFSESEYVGSQENINRLEIDRDNNLVIISR
jgi:hypothetical protein